MTKAKTKLNLNILLHRVWALHDERTSNILQSIFFPGIIVEGVVSSASPSVSPWRLLPAPVTRLPRPPAVFVSAISRLPGLESMNPNLNAVVCSDSVPRFRKFLRFFPVFFCLIYRRMVSVTSLDPPSHLVATCSAMGQPVQGPSGPARPPCPIPPRPPPPSPHPGRRAGGGAPLAGRQQVGGRKAPSRNCLTPEARAEVDGELWFTKEG